MKHVLKKKKKKRVEDVLKIFYGTEVPRPKLGLDFRVGSTTPFFKSLLYTALVSYKSESCSLTNAWQDFPEQRIKENPTYHRILGSFLGTSLPGICAWVGTKFQSHNHNIPLSPARPPRVDNIRPLIALTMANIR